MRHHNLIVSTTHLTLHEVREEARVLLEAVVVIQLVGFAILDLGEALLLRLILFLALRCFHLWINLPLLFLLIGFLLLRKKLCKHVLTTHVLRSLQHHLRAATTSTASPLHLFLFFIRVLLLVVLTLVIHGKTVTLLKLVSNLLLLHLQVVNLE